MFIYMMTRTAKESVWYRKSVNAEPLTWAQTNVLMRDSHNAFRNPCEYSWPFHRKWIIKGTDPYMMLWIIKDSYLFNVFRSQRKSDRFLICWICKRTHAKIICVVKVREDSRQNNLDFTPHTHTHSRCTHTNNYCVLLQTARSPV